MPLWRAPKCRLSKNLVAGPGPIGFKKQKMHRYAPDEGLIDLQLV
jgi:hypothetical protein